MGSFSVDSQRGRKGAARCCPQFLEDALGNEALAYLEVKGKSAFQPWPLWKLFGPLPGKQRGHVPL